MDSSLNLSHVRTLLNGAPYSELLTGSTGRCSSKLSVFAAPLFLLLLLSGTAPAAAVVSLLQRDTSIVSQRTLALQEEYTPAKKGPTEQVDKAELLRFVTPYGAELEAIVDITAYSQLLETVFNASGKIEFYAAIDTWVGNDTRRKIVYVDNVTGVCTAFNTSDGNAWNVSVDLVVWPKSPMQNIRPRTTIMLAESFPKPLVPIGEITASEGTLAGNELNLTEAADLKESDVFACPKGLDAFKKGARNGMIAQFAEQQFVASRSRHAADFLENLTTMMEESFLETLVLADLVAGSVKKVVQHPSKLLEVLLSEPAHLLEDMPVFFADGGTVTDQQYSSTLWLNMSTPFVPVGFVKHVINNSHFLANLTMPCFEGLNSTTFPGVQIPRNRDVIPTAKGKLQALLQLGVSSGRELLKRHEQPKANLQILHFHERALEEQFPMARVDIDSGSTSPQSVARAQKQPVCVVHQESTGHVLERPFTTRLLQGERAILHLTVTGHGWAATSEQCGEYCHAVYNLQLNGKSFANVTQWRDDCYLNPTGPSQHGTWFESRNGWCPGSVEPGVFIDITDNLDTAVAVNTFKLDLTVWLNATHRYHRYTDYNGFIQGDVAMLAVTTHVLVYGKGAVDAALAAPHASSKAEAAIRQGCSDPGALRPPAVVQNLPEGFVSSASARRQQREMTYPPEPVVPPQEVPFNFEARAPWYFYNASRETLPGLPLGAQYLPVFPGRLVQSNTRTVYGSVLEDLGLPADLSQRQLALRFRLLKPSHLEVDHWDRIGSLGLLVPKNLPQVQMKTTAPPPAKEYKYWQLSK